MTVSGQVYQRRGCLSALIAALLMGAGPAIAAPALAWVFPSGGQRGTTTTVYVHGAGLQRLTGVYVSGTGVTAEVIPTAPQAGKEPASSDDVRNVRLTISSNADLGGREVRVFDQSGISEPRVLYVGQWPEVNEIEPNETPETANPVTIPVTVNGKLQQTADQDCFRFTARAGQIVVCQVYCDRLYSMLYESPPEGFLQLLDTSGKVLAENTACFGWDPMVQLKIPADGAYVARLRDLLWRGGSSAAYRLTLSAGPFVETAFPMGLRRGSSTSVSLLGVNLSNSDAETISAPAVDDRDTMLSSFSQPAGTTNHVSFQLGNDPEVTEQEPDNDPAHATSVPVPAVLNGHISQPGQHAFFRFHADAHERLILEVYAQRGGSLLDSYLVLSDQTGKVLAANDDARGRDSVIDYTFPSAGEYIGDLSDNDGRGGPAYTYRVSIAPPRLDYRITTTPDAACVPVGGSARLDIVIHRWWGLDSPVHLHVEGLPSGVTASTAIAYPGMEHASIALTAERSADPEGQKPTPIRVVGEAEIGGKTISHTGQALQTYLLDGQPQQRSVTGPLTMIVQRSMVSLIPAVNTITIAKGAGASLPVSVEYSGASTRPLAIYMDGLPPGVTADSVQAPDVPGQVVISLHAAQDAPLVSTSCVVYAMPATPGARDPRAQPIACSVAVGVVVGGPAGASLVSGQGTQKVRLAK
jgi:hypothetical protein